MILTERTLRTTRGLLTLSLVTAGTALVPYATVVDREHVSAQEICTLKPSDFEIPDSVGITMIRIEPGTFSMGSPETEPGRAADEAQHTVTISRPFYIAETEITQDQYIPVTIPDYEPLFIRKAGWGTSLPELHSGGPFHTPGPGLEDSSRHPIEGVTWEKAVAFCEKLTERERKAGRLPAGYVYRLPTEAEWEYACRAGTAGAFNATIPLKQFAAAGGLNTTLPVKKGREPNAWGLYDMHGNVYEWCLDWYGDYESGAATDPTGPASGTKKVARGGCYLSGLVKDRAPDPARDQHCLRSAARGAFQPDFPLPIIGMRIVLAPETEAR